MIVERFAWIILLMNILLASMIIYTHYLVSNDYVMSSLMVIIMALTFAFLYRELKIIFKIIDREIEFIENYMFKGERR